MKADTTIDIYLFTKNASGFSITNYNTNEEITDICYDGVYEIFKKKKSFLLKVSEHPLPKSIKLKYSNLKIADETFQKVNVREWFRSYGGGEYNYIEYYTKIPAQYSKTILLNGKETIYKDHIINILNIIYDLEDELTLYLSAIDIKV